MVKREVNKSIFQTNGEVSRSCLRHTDLFAFHDAVSDAIPEFFKVVVGARNDFLLVVDDTANVLNQEDARLEQLYKANHAHVQLVARVVPACGC